MKKAFRYLTLDDFHMSPIWHPIDDLEDADMELEPFQGDLLSMEEIYLVASKFRFADGTELEGYIRFSWGEPVAAGLAISNKKFFLFGIGRLAEPEKRQQELAGELNKKSDDVLPLE